MISEKSVIIYTSIALFSSLVILLFISYIMFEIKDACQINLNKNKIVYCDGYKCNEEIQPENKELTNDEDTITISTSPSRKSMEKD